jgi:tetratricopeptide (TPR) repeat protein
MQLRNLVVLLFFLINVGLVMASSEEEQRLTGLIEKDKRDIPAYIALAGLELAREDISAASTTIKQGLRYARGSQDKLELRTLGIRLEDQNLDFKAALRHYRRAVRIKESSHFAAVHLAMAKVYLRARNFQQANELLRLSLRADSLNNEAAETALKRLQTMERAILVTNSPFAYAKSITRGEVTRLLNEDLEVGQYFKSTSSGSIGETSDQGLTDYADSGFADDILLIHRLNLRSFRISNGAFKPDREMTRRELALLVEDLLYLKFKVSRTSFIGTESPFSDLPSSATSFNAFMTAVTRGLMQASENGAIMPGQRVSGAEAILVLHNLKQMLQR